MKALLFSFILSVVAMPLAFSEVTWETNMEVAKQRAVKENKGLMIEFTGSDWCGYCIVLKKKVLTNEAFFKPAEKNYVFVELDFPKKALNAEQTAHNEKYKEIYQTEGFPTIIFTDATGTPLHSFIGNRSLDKALSELNVALEHQKSLPKLIQQYKEEKGDDRFKTLGKISEIVPAKYFPHFYPEFVEELKSDTHDISGVVKKLGAYYAKTKFDQITQDIRSHKIATLDDSFKVLNDYLANTPDIDALTKQNALELKARLFKNRNMIDDSIKCYKEAIALAPKTEIAESMQLMSKRLEADKANILIEIKQTFALMEFLSTLPDSTKNNVDLFVKELDLYIEKNNPTSYARHGALQLIFFALVSDNKIEESLVRLQGMIPLVEKDDPALANSVKMIQVQLKENGEALHKQLKDQWGAKFVTDFHLSRWLDYGLPIK